MKPESPLRSPRRRALLLSTAGALLPGGWLRTGDVVTVDDDGFVIDAKTSTSRTDWHICDGTNGTPDMRNKFIVGVGSDYTLHATGGNNKVTPTATIAGTALTIEQMPSHTHQVFQDCGVSGEGNVSSADEDHGPGGRYTSSVGGGQEHTHTATVSEIDTRSPYHALYYIMKIN